MVESTSSVYGPVQSGILANKSPKELLDKHGYFQCTTTTGLWQHNWCPILFSLIVDNFCVEYVSDRHAHHLRYALKEHYDIIENWRVTCMPE